MDEAIATRVLFTDVPNVKVSTIKMECTCGWAEYTYADRSAVEMAASHILHTHETGVIVYHGLVTKIPADPTEKENTNE